MRWLERLVERPPGLFRALFPGAEFRIPSSELGGRSRVYLTFDDGPIPEVTPGVLDILEAYDVKASFFMVGQNVERYPALLEEVRSRGHSVGNHTLRHLQGMKVSTSEYLADVRAADALIGSRLFRPPHGLLRPAQLRALRASHRIVMYDVVTRDYDSGLSAEGILRNVRELVRDGSIIVFHDSLKSWPRLREALPRSLEFLLESGYECLPL